MVNFQRQLLYGAVALAAHAFADSTKSLIFCTTLLGRQSVNPVPTKTFAPTFTSKATVKFTSTPVTTVTPPADTLTFTDTTTETSVTTAPQNTQTFSETTTNTITDTETTSVLITVLTTVSTTTTSAGTSTIPTSSGFTPAGSETSTGSLAKRTVLAKRAVVAPSKVSIGSNGRPTFSPALYPKSVLCAGVIEVFASTTKTYTATSTATVTGKPPPPSSTTVTVSETTTSTVVPPDASTTLTFTTSTTVSTTTTQVDTTTSTITQTQTVLLPTATYYAACGPNNQLSSVGNVNFSGFGYRNNLQQTTLNSAYDCCVACLTSSTCGAAAYYAGGKICFQISDNGNCSPNNLVLDYFGSASDPAGQLFISTSNCGAVIYTPEG